MNYRPNVDTVLYIYSLPWWKLYTDFYESCRYVLFVKIYNWYLLSRPSVPLFRSKDVEGTKSIIYLRWLWSPAVLVHVKLRRFIVGSGDCRLPIVTWLTLFVCTPSLPMLVVLLVLSGGFLLLTVFFAYQASGVESASIPSDRQSHADQPSVT